MCGGGDCPGDAWALGPAPNRDPVTAPFHPPTPPPAFPPHQHSMPAGMPLCRAPLALSSSKRLPWHSGLAHQGICHAPSISPWHLPCVMPPPPPPHTHQCRGPPTPALVSVLTQ